MTTSLALAALWGVTANLIALFPSRDNHWRAAYMLTAVGIPILGLVTWQNGPLIGLLILVMGMSVLRWPVIYLTRWIKHRAGGTPDV